MSNYKALKIVISDEWRGAGREDAVFVTVDVQDNGMCKIIDHDIWRKNGGGYLQTPMVYWYSTPDNKPCVEVYDLNCAHIFFDLVEVGTHVPVPEDEWQEMKRKAKEGDNVAG